MVNQVDTAFIGIGRNQTNGSWTDRKLEHFGIIWRTGEHTEEIYDTGAQRPEPMEKELSIVEIFVTDFMEFSAQEGPVDWIVCELYLEFLIFAGQQKSRSGYGKRTRVL